MNAQILRQRILAGMLLLGAAMSASLPARAEPQQAPAPCPNFDIVLPAVFGLKSYTYTNLMDIEGFGRAQASSIRKMTAITPWLINTILPRQSIVQRGCEELVYKDASGKESAIKIKSGPKFIEFSMDEGGGLGEAQGTIRLSVDALTDLKPGGKVVQTITKVGRPRCAEEGHQEILMKLRFEHLLGGSPSHAWGQINAYDASDLPADLSNALNLSRSWVTGDKSGSCPAVNSSSFAKPVGVEKDCGGSCSGAIDPPVPEYVPVYYNNSGAAK